MLQREPGEILRDFGYTRYVLLEEQYGEQYAQYTQTQVCFAPNSVILMKTDMANQQAEMIELSDIAFSTLLVAFQDYVGHITEMAAPRSSTTLDDDIPNVLKDQPF